MHHPADLEDLVYTGDDAGKIALVCLATTRHDGPYQ